MSKNDLKNELYRPGQLARITGVSTDMLRHYERKGLLKSRRSPNGYPPRAAHTLLASIKNACMTKKLIAILLMTVFFAGAVFAQTTVRAKKLKTVTIRIDGFMKSKSGAI